MIEDVARLVELHLRFHGYGTGEWTDSAVRRYVTDAGPLLDRLHKLTRSDCTTRNRRKAEALSRAYDDLEERIARLQEQEELDAIRPDLDGNAIMEILGIAARPGGRQGLKHLLELRLEHGPMSQDAARRGAQGVVGRSAELTPLAVRPRSQRDNVDRGGGRGAACHVKRRAATAYVAEVAAVAGRDDAEDGRRFPSAGSIRAATNAAADTNAMLKRRRRRRTPGRGRRRRRSCTIVSTQIFEPWVARPRTNAPASSSGTRLEQHHEHGLDDGGRREARRDPVGCAEPAGRPGVTTRGQQEAGAGGGEGLRQHGQPGVDVRRVVEVVAAEQEHRDRRDAVAEPVRADRGQRVAGRPALPARGGRRRPGRGSTCRRQRPAGAGRARPSGPGRAGRGPSGRPARPRAR